MCQLSETNVEKVQLLFAYQDELASLNTTLSRPDCPRRPAREYRRICLRERLIPELSEFLVIAGEAT